MRIREQQKGFSVTAVLLMMVVIATISGVAWYVWQKRPVDDTSKKSTATDMNNSSTVGCDQVNNSVFRSIAEYEMSPQVKGPSEITFNHDTFQRTYTDIVQSGPYTCKDSVVEAKIQTLAGDTVINAVYDSQDKTLNWSDMIYKKVE